MNPAIVDDILAEHKHTVHIYPVLNRHLPGNSLCNRHTKRSHIYLGNTILLMRVDVTAFIILK